ncbi:MAG: GntR family transcriptional regulator, partial [Candidatus Thiodiazotropha sp.]
MQNSSSTIADEPVNITLTDRLFDALQQAIVEGEIPQGSKISEPELARRHGVSRGSLREAIARLEARKLVERKPNLGARVVTLSYEQLIEIFQLREALEGMAARLAAQNMSGREIEELQALL